MKEKRKHLDYVLKAQPVMLLLFLCLDSRTKSPMPQPQTCLLVVTLVVPLGTVLGMCERILDKCSQAKSDCRRGFSCLMCHNKLIHFELFIKCWQISWWGGSVGNGTWWQAQRLKFDHWDLHSGIRERTVDCLLTSTSVLWRNESIHAMWMCLHMCN